MASENCVRQSVHHAGHFTLVHTVYCTGTLCVLALIGVQGSFASLRRGVYRGSCLAAPGSTGHFAEGAAARRVHSAPAETYHRTLQPIRVAFAALVGLRSRGRLGIAFVPLRAASQPDSRRCHPSGALEVRSDLQRPRLWQPCWPWSEHCCMAQCVHANSTCATAWHV